MSSNFSNQINNIVPSAELKDLMVSSNNSNEKSNKPSSHSDIKNLWNSLKTDKTNGPTYQEITDFIKNIVKSIIPPEKLKKYEEYEDYIDEKARKQIIKDIEDVANEIKNLKEKVEELSRAKNMESIGLNTDINIEYISLNEAMREMMKELKLRNNELLSKVSNSENIIKGLKEEINRLTKCIENKNNSKKNVHTKTLENNIFKTEYPIIKPKNYNNEYPLLDNEIKSRNSNKNTDTIVSPHPTFKNKIHETLSQRKNNKSNIYNYKYMYRNFIIKKLKYKSKSKYKLNSNNISNENNFPLQIISYKQLEKAKNNDNKK